jgi:hypothetical protein
VVFKNDEGSAKNEDFLNPKPTKICLFLKIWYQKMANINFLKIQTTAILCANCAF